MPHPLGVHFAVTLGVIIGLGVFWLVAPVAVDLDSEAHSSSKSAADIPIVTTKPSLPGSSILKNYARDSQPPQQDLTDLSRALGNFALLVKGDQPIPLGANEEIAAALRGKNKTQMRFLPDDAPCFDAQGQLVDRWQMPLFFHAMDKDRIDIRSAGPDKTMWTADDIHRRYDGQFVRGEALNAPSLLDATKDYRGGK
jgi:hypothetical protein